MRRICSKLTLIALVVLVKLSSLLKVPTFGVGFVSGCHEAEREALLKFKQSLTDPSNRLSSWQGHDCCHWSGIRCHDVTGHVHALDLRLDFPNSDPYEPTSYYRTEEEEEEEELLWASKRLRADKLEPSLGELRQLRLLDLSGNDFTGIQIPEFIGSMKHLRYLYLSRASFSGDVPPSLGNLTTLRVLDLSFNWFRNESNLGFFSYLKANNLGWISGLVHLQRLDLSWCDLSNARDSMQPLSKLPNLSDLRLRDCDLDQANLPHVFSNSSWLNTIQHLDLSSNYLQGSVPYYLANMTSLRSLDLSSNSFNGSIPLWLRNMRALESLNLQVNYFRQVEGGTIMGLLGNPCHLKSLDLSDNSLQGRIGGPHDNFSHCITPLLETLDLGGNSLTGTLPYSLGQLTKLQYLDLSLNLFQGPLPSSLGALSSLKVLQLGGWSSEVVLFGSMHLANLSNLEWLDLSFTPLNLNFTSDWLPPFQLHTLLLHSCNITGQIPKWIGTQTELSDLDLSQNLFGGQIPQSLGHCKKLQLLDLSNNNLTGKIPESLGWCRNLETVELSNNNLTGKIPESLGWCRNLETVDLSNNNLTGKIPESLGKCNKLEELDLSSNRLEGVMTNYPFGNLSSLVSLRLSENYLKGQIPESLGQCKQLQLLTLSSNSFQGMLSSHHLANLSHLDTLDLSYNSLTFNFTSHWTPPFQLTEFFMSSCGIRGQLPPWIQTQHKLESLDLSDNMITGKILDWSQNLGLGYMNLSHNRIVGPITHFPSQISTIDLSYNSLSGPLSQDVTGTRGKVGTSLCQLTTLGLLNLQSNNITGTITDDCWVNSSDSLYAINLSFNRLSGPIPLSIGLLPSLQFLNLNNNELKGEIPRTFSICGNLEILDLSENRLSGEVPSLEVQKDPVLRILRLRNNQLGGSIPQGLCSQTQLKILDLARNNLTGGIPRCFGHFNGMGSVFLVPPNSSYAPATSPTSYPPSTAMVAPEAATLNAPAPAPFASDPHPYPEYENTTVVLKGQELQYTRTLKLVESLDLSCNALEGSIPEEITNLVGLIGLNLSYNHLDGTIPEKIGQMRSLLSLDLSNNKLSGTIPSSMSSLYSLSYLNLSNNKLHGEIPTGNQLQTLNDPSMYAGNPGLCGDPLPKCSRGNGKEDGQEEEADQDKEGQLDTVLLYLFVALGFVTGFWGVVGTLIFKKQWRYVLFGLVEDFVDYVSVRAALMINRMRK